VGDRQRPRQVGEEDDARLQRRDQDGLQPLVVRGDRGAELVDARLELLRAEVNVSDAFVELQDASFRP
jgi:hypothetical protein